MNRGIQIAIGVLSILLALAASIYGRETYLREVSTYQIPVPIRDIPPYTSLTEEMFQLRDMPRTMESLAYFQKFSDMAGMITTAPLTAGLPVANTSAVPAKQFRLADARFEVVSIPVKPVSAVGGQIQIGQRVNLYRILEEKSPEGEVSSSKPFQIEVIAKSVPVVDIRNSQGAQAGPTAGAQQSNGSLSGDKQVEQVQILTLALEPDLVGTVLEAVAISEKQGGLLWTTLAIP